MNDPVDSGYASTFGVPAVRAAGRTLPRILLVDDDPTTLGYLQALTEALPAQVETAGTVTEALRLAQAQRHDLWLVDANLPDGNGASLLARLRAAGLRTPALAHTAARERSELDALVRAGFLEALAKPVDADAWRAALKRALGHDSSNGAAKAAAANLMASDAGDALPLWNDAAAARALGGDPAHIATLRGLFLAELPGQLAAIREHGAAARHAQLHRLRASCALVGAARLDAAVRALQDAPESATTLHAFVDAAQATLDQAGDMSLERIARG